MKIDGHPYPKKALELSQQGRKKEAYELEMAMINEIVASGEDHCPCKVACKHHGNCFECVQIHRAHRDHLPFCFWDMINERLETLSRLTEGSLKDYRPCNGEYDD